MQSPRTRFVLPLALVVTQPSCGVDLTRALGVEDAASGESQAASSPILANAGADRQVLGGYPTHLHGGASARGASASVTYRWEQISGEPVYLSNAAAPTPSFVAPLEPQTLAFRLTVDDGRWRNQDRVELRVRRARTQQPPRIRLAADQGLQTELPEQPNPDWLLATVPENADIEWERIQLTPSQSGSDMTSPSGWVAFRAVARANGLSSAPDHIVVRTRASEQLGQRPPLAAVDGPTVVTPGETVVLSAKSSSDPNGDPLQYDWLQLQGEPVAQLPRAGPELVFTAPRQPQQLSFRLYASDAASSSAPADVNVVVAGPEQADRLQLNGPPQLQVHPGNVLWADALGGTPEPAADVSYEWLQTYGPELPFDTSTNGRFLRLTAPETGTARAFAVRAHFEAWRSTPSVTIVRTVAKQSNTPPKVHACVERMAEDAFIAAAYARDPEFDPVADTAWYPVNPADAVTVEPLDTLTGQDERNGGANAPCPLPSDMLPQPSPHVHTAAAQVTFAAPLPEPLSIAFEACDELDACAARAVEIAP